MTDRERFEKWLNTLDKQTLMTMTAKQARTIEELQAATKAAVPEGFNVVPVEPTHSTGEWSMYKQSRNKAIDECKGAILEAGFEVE